MTPFEAAYGYLPSRFPTYELEATTIEAVDETLRTCDQILSLLHKNLLRAQSQMKKYADLKQSEREFKVGDHV